MRLAFVCRDLAADRLTGVGPRVFATARAMARSGHEVYLISEELVAWRARALLSAGSPTWVRAEPARPDHRYLVEEHEYADRVHDTLRALHGTHALDMVEFADAGAEGFTTIRAKRLLAAFPATTLVVTLNPWAGAETGPAAHRSLTFHRPLVAAAERYCREHADVVVPLSPVGADPGGVRSGRVGPVRRPVVGPVGGPTAGRPVGEPTAGRPAGRVVWRLGTLRPGAGVETFLRAVALVHERDPDIRFVLRGEDTDTDPLGRSYWRHLRRGLAPGLRDAVAFHGPLRAGGGPPLPPAGSRCVLPEGAAECPTSAALAMALGYAVVAPAGSTAAAVVEPGVTGTVVPPADPAALAAALRADPVAPTTARTRSGDGPLWTPPRPGRPAHEAGHRGRPPLVSVVIPVYNQGRFLRQAVGSARASGYPALEIVVVDDGSTDPATTAAFDALTGVVKVRQPNRGLSAARNAGIAASRGRYVVPLDADDALPPAFLTAAVAALERNPELAYAVGYLRYVGLLDHTQATFGFAGDVSLILNTHGRATGVFRRAALAAVGGYDESLPAYEDWDLHIRLHEAGYTSDVLPIDGQLYRRHEASMTFTYANDHRTELLQLLLRKHAERLAPNRALPLLLTMTHLWKTGYEPSASVHHQHRARQRVGTDG